MAAVKSVRIKNKFAAFDPAKLPSCRTISYSNTSNKSVRLTCKQK